MGLPHFIIIGAQRSGTTSLYNYLCQHACVLAAAEKEVHFFDLKFHRGVAWYHSQFPSLAPEQITGEASPYYLFHPHVPQRIRTLLPDIKLILLLRNPCDRAYSHYRHEVRLGAEELTFEAALDREVDRLRDETARLLEDDSYYSFNHQHYSYQTRGEYVIQLHTWHELFSREKILILKSEDLYDAPAAVFQSVTEFLGVPQWQPPSFRKHNDGQNMPMNDETRRRLVQHFRPWNRRLYEFLGKDFGWDV